MIHDVYPEEDSVLLARAPLALQKTYTLAEATRISNRVHAFDTLDGYKIIVAMVLDADVLFLEKPIMMMIVRPQPNKDVVIPKTDAGLTALASSLLIRLGLRKRVTKFLKTEFNKTMNVWMEVK